MRFSFEEFKHIGSMLLRNFGVLWLVVESIALFDSRVSALGIKAYLAIVAISIIITTMQYFRRKNFSVLLKHMNIKISVTTTDLLDSKGCIVIGSCDTFDTELGDIINPNSLIGKFITRIYNSNIAEVDSNIEDSLSGISFIEDNDKVFGKKKRYEIGTVAVLKRNNNRYFLTAMQHMKQLESRVTTELMSMWNSLDKCWGVVKNQGNHAEVHVPVFGTKFGRTSLSYNEIICHTVSSFLFSSRSELISNHLIIHVYKGDVDKVDFIALRNWLESHKGN